MKKSITRLMLVVVMLIGMIPLSAITAFAESTVTVTYIDENGTKQTAENCIRMASVEAVDDYSFEAGEWYVVDGTFTVNNRIENNAPSDNPAHLILGYGGILKALQGIHNPTGKGLIIYIHSTYNEGGLEATIPETDTQNGNAGIGGNSGQNGGNIIINGGRITAIGGENGGAGIGGGNNGAGGTVIINGCTVTATGGSVGGAGIGGGNNGDGGTITINGCTVTATGIGGGNNGAGGTVSICGWDGKRNATINSDSLLASIFGNGNVIVIAALSVLLIAAAILIRRKKKKVTK